MASKWISGELFPTKFSFFIFIAYMGLFVNQGILVTASQSSGNRYNYNITAVVLLTECVKLITAVLIYVKNNTVKDLMFAVLKNKKVFILYFVPAGLYCVYNNLGFVNLASYDPTTYFLLLQFRVVVTGVIFQALFQKRLSRIQWLSLIFLTTGCIVKEIGHHHGTVDAGSQSFNLWDYVDIHLVLIMVQVVCSCFAGVYNEYLLKNTACDVHIMVQNIFLYIDSIVCNLAILAVRMLFYPEPTVPAINKDVANVDQSTQGNNNIVSAILLIIQPMVLILICNNAAIGIVTSLFLHSLNCILKTFASALELMITAVLCWILFGIKIDIYTVIAITIVTAAAFIYAQNPVVNRAKNEIDVERQLSSIDSNKT